MLVMGRQEHFLAQTFLPPVAAGRRFCYVNHNADLVHTRKPILLSGREDGNSAWHSPQCNYSEHALRNNSSSRQRPQRDVIKYII